MRRILLYTSARKRIECLGTEVVNEMPPSITRN